MKYIVKEPKKISKPQPDDKPITFDLYYEIVGETEKADLIDGNIIRDSPAIPKHARIISWLHHLLRSYIEKFDLGEVMGSTVTVRLSNYQSPEPDLLFIRKERLGIIREKYIAGAPDLCVEIVSRSSRKIDRTRKFVLYADYNVREYWIVDPLYDTVEFYENQSREFVQIQPDEHGRLHSKVIPGFWLKPEWLFSDPLKLVADVFDEILSQANQ